MSPPPKPTTIKTNSKVDSVCDEKHVPILFNTMWDNYPSEHPCHDPKGNVPKEYENQCAMSLGYALEKSGVTFKSYTGGRCPWGPKDGGMVTEAQGLANWLRKRPFCGCPAPETYTGETVFDKIASRTGILFLADYWERSAGDRSGDHIDLWNGSRLKSSVSTWFRIHLHLSWDGWFSDFRRAKQAIFWFIK